MPADTSAIDITNPQVTEEPQTEQAPVTETPKVEAAPSPDKARLDQLAKNERRLRQQSLQLRKEREAFLKEREDALKPKPEPVAPINWEERISTDPIGTIKSANLEIEYLKAELKAIKDSQDASLKSVTESQTRAYQQALAQVSRDVNKLTLNNEAFEAIQATKSQSAVVALIESTYKEDGILLTAEEAANQVEEFLIDSTMPLTKLKKIQAKLAPPVATPPAKRTAPQQQIHVERVQPTTSASRTLTNALVASSTPASAKEKRARAIAAFNGNKQ